MTLSKQHTVVKSVIAHEYDNREQAKSSKGISGSLSLFRIYPPDFQGH